MHNYGLIKLYMDEDRTVSLKNRKETLELIQEVCLWQLIPTDQRNDDEDNMVCYAERKLANCYGENCDYFELFLESIEKDMCLLNRVLNNASLPSFEDRLVEILEIFTYSDYDSSTDDE